MKRVNNPLRRLVSLLLTPLSLTDTDTRRITEDVFHPIAVNNPLRGLCS